MHKKTSTTLTAQLSHLNLDQPTMKEIDEYLTFEYISPDNHLKLSPDQLLRIDETPIQL